MSDEIARGWMSKWGMPDTTQGLHLTKEWAEGNITSDWFCQAFAVLAVYEGIQGVMFIKNTLYSKEVYHRNINLIRQGHRYIEQPHWYHYNVNWFPRSTLLNWKDISADYCKRQDISLGPLAGVLDRMEPIWLES